VKYIITLFAGFFSSIFSFIGAEKQSLDFHNERIARVCACALIIERVGGHFVQVREEFRPRRSGQTAHSAAAPARRL